MKEQIRAYITESCPWQDSVLYFDSIDSTNTHAKMLAAGGAPHGTVLIADHQTGGRGRLGRSFLSPAGCGIYMSVILRPNCPPVQLMHLTCAAAVAMCDAVEASAGFRPGIKWTNDMVYGGKKLAVILTELGISASGLVDYAIVGVGINCSQRPQDFSEEIRSMAGSLSMAAGRTVERPRIAAAMIESLYRMDRELLTAKAALMDRYRADCVTLGRDISLVKADGSVRYGTAVGIDDEGALLVRFGDGAEEAVNSGEVSVRGMYGYA